MFSKLFIFLFLHHIYNCSLAFSPLYSFQTRTIAAALVSRKDLYNYELCNRNDGLIMGHYNKHLLKSSQNDDAGNSEEGSSLAADFFKALQQRNIQLDDDDLLDEEEDDDDEDDDVDENNNSLFEAEGGNIDDKSNITNEQVYSELKERVLESAGAFIDLVGGAKEDDEDDDEEQGPKPYVTPEVVPDSALTAGEVVTTVLEALLNNDVPYPDRGVEVLFGYSSPGSAVSQAIRVEGMTAAEYGDFLKEEESEYNVLFDHLEVVIDKGDYSFDKKKAFFTARLRVGPGPLDFTSVNFILSTEGNDEDDCWLIDSMLIRPEGMRRRRRR